MSSQYDDLPKTPNLNLNRPTYDNNADIEALNENFDILDEEVYNNKNNRITSIAPTTNEAEFTVNRYNGTTETVTLVKKSRQNIVDIVYPVGSIYMSTASTSPATLFGGTWEALDDGRVLIGANSTYAAGATGGEFQHKITVNELPSHSHTVTVTSAGAHTHGGVTGNAGSHTHGPGTLDLVGTFGTGSSTPSLYKNDTSGVFTNTGSNGKKYASGETSNNDRTSKIKFKAYGNWSGKTASVIDHSHSITSGGDHTHETTVTATGGNTKMNNMQPYLAVYMWKRTA